MPSIWQYDKHDTKYGRQLKYEPILENRIH